MAKLTATLSSPKSQASPQAPVRESSSIQGVGALVQGGIGLFKQAKQQQQLAQKKADALEGGSLIGSAQESILDLEDERNALALEDQQLSSQVQQITQDGITSEETDMLASLEKQRAKLTTARKGGLLNPLSFQTRMNALHRQALADVSNLALQPQINSLFSQGRSLISAPASNTEQKTAAAMDTKYGVGNWSGVDLGREKGRGIYLAQLQKDASNNFETFIGQEAMAFMNIADTHVRNVRNTLNTKGAIQDIDLDSYRAGINQSTQVLLTNINTAVAENRKNGTPVDIDTVKRSRANVLEQQSFYLNFLKEGQEFGGNAQLSQRLSNMNTIVDEINKARNPSLGAISSSIAGSGSNGDITSLAQLVSAPDSLLQGVAANLPPSLQIDANTMRTNAAQAVAMALDGVDFKEAAASGLVNKRLAATVASVGLRTTDNPKSLNSYHSAMSDVDYSNTEGALDLYNRPDTINNLKATPEGNERMPSVAVHFLDNIKSEITPAEAEFLKVLPDGSLIIDLPDDPAARARVGRFSLYTNKLLAKFNTFATTYEKEIGIKKERLVEELMQSLRPKKEVSEGE